MDNEEEAMRKVAKALENYINSLPRNLYTADVSEILKATIGNTLDEVNEKHLMMNFDLTKDFAEKFIYNAHNWETDIEGAVGGIGLYYSNSSGWYYYFVSKYIEKTRKIKVFLYKLEKVAIREWLLNGWFDECLSNATAIQLV
jgi:hypothetical protein